MSELNKEIDQYILENPRLLGEAGYYSKVGQIFGAHPEKVRKRYRQLKAQGHVVDYATSGYVHVVDGKKYYTDTPTITYTTASSNSPKPEFQEGFTSIGGYTSKVKSYNAWIKNKAGEIEVKPLYSVETKFDKDKSSFEADKKLFLEEIKNYSPYDNFNFNFNFNYDPLGISQKKFAVEINIPDLHIGKLAWGKETGEDYDIKIAVQRYKIAVDDLISRVDKESVEKIILPIGNDLIHVDNQALTTTAGTYVNSDSRFGKMFQTAKELLINTIEKLSLIAPVDVIVIPGNHDQVATFTLGEVLDAWFHTHQTVKVINTHTPRKYYQYGKNLIMYTHGHREKLNDLGIICATEQPELWAATKFRRVHVGHFHHSKQVKFVDVQEYPGFTVKILNSLSGTDAWHAEKGYLSLKAAEMFVYDKDKGLIGNFFHYSE